MWNPFRLLFGGQTFEAAGRGRRLKTFTPSHSHINQQIAQAGPTLNARARYLVANDGYAGNALEAFTSTVVGDGVKPRPKIESREDRETWLREFRQWAGVCDADGLRDWYGLQDLIVAETFTVGECFVRFRARRPEDMDAVPFQLQVLPTEMLDLSHDMDLGGGRYIKAGIEFNGLGQRLAYHFWRQHPGDVTPGLRRGHERVRVPAVQVVHVIDPRCAGQIRGVSRFARAIVPLFMLSSYDDAELDRKRTAALFGLAIEQENGFQSDTDEADSGEDPDELTDLTPGLIARLRPGEKASPINPADVGGSYEAWQYRQLLRIAAALQVPYTYVSGDTAKGNFSNNRTDIIRFRRAVKTWVNRIIIHQLSRPVLARFHDVGAISGRLAMPPPEVTFLTSRQEWLDPAKDVKSEIEQIKAGLKSRTAALAERGLDIEDVDRERADEAKANPADKSAPAAPGK